MMEGVLAAAPCHRCSPIIVLDKAVCRFAVVDVRSVITTNGVLKSAKKLSAILGDGSSNAPVQGKRTEDQGRRASDWKAEFLGEVDPPGSQLSAKKKWKQSELLPDNSHMDWCVGARKTPLKSIETRGLIRDLQHVLSARKKRKIPRKNKKVNRKSKKIDVSDFEEMSKDARRQTISSMGDVLFEETTEQTDAAFAAKYSQISGSTDRKKEISLNKAFVSAQTAEEVLDLASEMMSAVGNGLRPSPLTPLNLATALHRIARHMVNESMMKHHRLAFARQRDMSMLVSIAMAVLPECSPRGISNIAWALSKIGGGFLYISEMDRIAEVALTKVSEFNAQTVANVAAAFASMRHSSPQLFVELSKRASTIISTFTEQAVSQALWASASLYENVDPMLDALDNTYNEVGAVTYAGGRTTSPECSSDDLDEAMMETSCTPILKTSSGSTLLSFNRNQLGVIAWSYAVFGQMSRPFFSLVWMAIRSTENDSISVHCREERIFATQIRLVYQCLRLEYPYLGLSLGQDFMEKIVNVGDSKQYNDKITSSFQKDVVSYLAYTSLRWDREYMVDGYTLDVALVDKKIALEIDGPTHFTRNLGCTLGHTILKHRYIAAAGWKLVSVNHEEWDKLKGISEHLEYLRSIVDKVMSESEDE